jgi:ribosomal protein S18 acetylase RimI-like enzyme
MLPLFKEVVTGVMGAVVVSIIALLAAFTRDSIVKRRYPVAGKFVTYFEDVVDGKIQMQTGMSRIKQRGRRISGATTQKNGRKWLLDGTIAGIGHIAGVYSAEAVDDEGVGSFYLRVNGTNLEGIWSGYDHVNKITTSGRYLFQRLMDLQIKPLHESHIPAILGIADKEFGPNYISEEDLRSDSGVKILVGLNNKKVVGFITGEIASVSNKLKERVSLPKDVLHAEGARTLGIIKTVAVTSQFHRHGIGDRLFVEMERQLQQSGGTLIAVPAWKDHAGVHLHGILASNGYEEFLTCKRYWKDDCHSGLFTCRSRARSKECSCDLVWYKRPLA